MYFKQLVEKIDQYREKRDVFHDLMQFKVREILLVSTMYDSYIIEQEGDLGDVVYGEYKQLDLSFAPRITSVHSAKGAMEKLKTRDFDMVIIMVGLDFASSKILAEGIKKENSSLPITFLFNNNSTYAAFSEKFGNIKDVDHTFIWNGDSSVFLAMIKLVEDKGNIDNDTKLGMVRVILLVEDSVKYYSRYLPILYSEIMRQTSGLIESEYSDSRKLLRMRARPKVYIASNYEEAVEVFEKYEENMLCVISDVHYKKDGKGDRQAGIRLMKYVRQRNETIPLLLQSGDAENCKKAEKINAFFLNKSSESFVADLRHFILAHLGFGKFYFKEGDGPNVIAEASNIEEFETIIKKISLKSLLYHAENNHFSTWLMARGEVQLAKVVKSFKASHFSSHDLLRDFLIDVFDSVKQLKTKGLVVGFQERYSSECDCIFRLFPGSLGGKGRGIAFINNLIYKVDFKLDNVEMRVPMTGIIGTDAFDQFLENNELGEVIHSEMDYGDIRKRFVKAKLPFVLKERLYKFIRDVEGPIAVRSSGFFEDMLMRPSAGIYETYFLPNTAKNADERLRQLVKAVKLIYASIYSPTARAYFKALSFEIEDEKMGIIIQKVVGREYGKYYYPHISGTAQSRNHYPVSYIKPEDGIAVVATGLGTYVVDGDNAFRFCPKYPKMDIISEGNQIKNTQQYLYCVDLENKAPDIMDGEISCYTKLLIRDAKKNGSMKHILSYLDFNNNRINPGVCEKGIDIVNFPNILKYDHLQFAKAIEAFLELGEKSMGTPVEIEFAFDIDPEDDSRGYLYVLQLKPMVHYIDDADIDITGVKDEELALFTTTGMGNGKIETIKDVVFIDFDKFDKTKTRDMVREVAQLNASFNKSGEKYILIGPGRWGTRDPLLGIPVNFVDICNSKIIVEAGIQEYQIDASLGSHFFHNVISMNMGYFTVNFQSDKSFIDWEWLKSFKPHNRTEHFIHIKFDKPLEILMDGKKGVSLIKKV